MPYTLADGEKLVKAARSAIELNLTSPHFKKEMVNTHISHMEEEHGVFVTIEHYPTKELRGCIGFPRAVGKLKDLLIDAAIAAATEDPRFVPISHLEFDHIVIEVSILSDPEPIKGKGDDKIKKEIKIGRDGLIIQSGYHSGLLLPIVPVEQEWSKEEYLENLCMKAGLPKFMWRHSHVNLYKFTTQVFRETSPGGHVEKVALE